MLRVNRDYRNLETSEIARYVIFCLAWNVRVVTLAFNNMDPEDWQRVSQIGHLIVTKSAEAQNSSVNLTNMMFTC